MPAVLGSQGRLVAGADWRIVSLTVDQKENTRCH